MEWGSSIAMSLEAQSLSDDWSVELLLECQGYLLLLQLMYFCSDSQSGGQAFQLIFAVFWGFGIFSMFTVIYISKEEYVHARASILYLTLE